MDQLLDDLEAQKEKLEKEYHDATTQYRSALLDLEHKIIERSKELSIQDGGADAPADGWNSENEGVVKAGKQEGEHLFEREQVYDGGSSEQ